MASDTVEVEDEEAGIDFVTPGMGNAICPSEAIPSAGTPSTRLGAVVADGWGALTSLLTHFNPDYTFTIPMDLGSSPIEEHR